VWDLVQHGISYTTGSCTARDLVRDLVSDLVRDLV
jgi:hypothetical protein